MKRLLSLVLAVSITATTSFAHTITTNTACWSNGYSRGISGTIFDKFETVRIHLYNGVKFKNGTSDSTFYTGNSTTFFLNIPQAVRTTPTKFSVEYSVHNNSNYDDAAGSPYNTGTVACSTMPVLLTNYIVNKVPGDKVSVKWTTTSEQNNSHFTVQGSNDGLNYTDIGMVFSYTESGNSSISHDYAFTFDNTVHVVKAGLGIFSILFLVLIVAAGFKRKSFPFAAMALMITLGSFTACSKSNAVPSITATYKFIRLQQVDKDGTVTTYDTKTVS